MSRMNDVSRLSIGVCLGLLLIGCAMPLHGQQSAATSSAVVPSLVSFSSVLTDLNGKPLTNITGVTFLFYQEQQGGAPLWLETQNVQPDKTGRYSVLLGSTSSTGLPANIFVAGEARWLGVQPQGQAEQPRIMLLSVPYAMKAGDAQTVGGLPPSAFVLAAPPASTSAGTTPATAGAQPLATGTTPVTTAGGTANVLAKWDATADITNSQIFDNGTNVGIGTATPAAKLDVKGTAAVRGLFVLPAIGTATATTGYTSQPLKMTASAFNNGTAKAIAQNFQLQAEPVGNNTSGTSGMLNLLYSTGTNKLAETGLQIAGNGQITFAAGQTFPGTGTGNGSVTSVGTGLGLTGGPITSSGTVAIDPTVVPQLNVSNVFTGNQTVSGNLSTTGLVTGTGFQIGSNLFAFGSYSNFNAFVGFSGNATMSGAENTGNGTWALSANTTGSYNTANGQQALWANTTGSGNVANGAGALLTNLSGNVNTANGQDALYSNTTGSDNVASGGGALYNNTIGYYNTASGSEALNANTTGWDNTGTGASALGSNTSGTNNTGDGYNALLNNATGSNNTALGYDSGPDPNYPGLNNATAIGAFADVTESNAVVLGSILGVNNCTTQNNCASTNVGIGTTAPQYTLDVHGTGNFTGLVTFASGQTFPGAITGVTAGTGLTGGGTSGNVTLNLNTGLVPELGAANTFTGVQTFNNNVTITGAGSGNTLTASGTAATGVFGSGTNTGLQGEGGPFGVVGLGTQDGVYGNGIAANSYGVYGNGPTGVFGYATTIGVEGYATGTGSYGVYGVGTQDGVFGNGPVGVSGFTTTNGGSGVRGQDSSSGGGYAVYGSSTKGTGVYGTGATGVYGVGGSSGTGTTGVYGTSSTQSGSGVSGSGNFGVVGLGNTVGTVAGTGVSGQGTGAGVDGYGPIGVYGQANVPNGYGVYGVSNGSSGNYAGYFSGNMAVTGAITAGTKDFKIDHPLDPANKYLYHASVESSEMMNIYTGNITTDAHGDATVQLPDWFEALNADFRYQLTVIGQFAQAIIGSEIANHQFQIRTDKPNVKVSWQVTGIRQDAFARAHPIILEMEKTGDERGRYLHPVEHGLPKSMGIDESRRAKMLAQHPEPPKLPERATLPVPQQYIAVPEPAK